MVCYGLVGHLSCCFGASQIGFIIIIFISVVWRGVAWCGVAWCGTTWFGVVNNMDMRVCVRVSTTTHLVVIRDLCVQPI